MDKPTGSRRIHSFIFVLAAATLSCSSSSPSSSRLPASAGSECRSNSDCGGRLCLHNVCGCAENSECSLGKVCSNNRCAARQPCGHNRSCARQDDVCIDRGGASWCTPPSPTPGMITVNVMQVTPSAPDRPRPFLEPVEFAFTCRVGTGPIVRIPASDLQHSPTGRFDVPWPRSCGTSDDVLDTIWTVYAVSLRCRRSVDSQPIERTPSARRVVTLLIECAVES